MDIYWDTPNKREVDTSVNLLSVELGVTIRCYHWWAYVKNYNSSPTTTTPHEVQPLAVQPAQIIHQPRQLPCYSNYPWLELSRDFQRVEVLTLLQRELYWITLNKREKDASLILLPVRLGVKAATTTCGTSPILNL